MYKYNYILLSTYIRIYESILQIRIYLCVYVFLLDYDPILSEKVKIVLILSDMKEE